MLPSLRQARKVIWEGIDREGRKMIDQSFPKELRSGVNNTDMTIKLKNGSVWSCVGSDNYDSLVGTNPVGVIFSEYSLTDPDAWTYIRPILRENDGWAIFIYTPRGRTHGFDLYDMAQSNDKWFCEKLTIDETGILTSEDVEEEIDSGMSREKALQEFYCSFDVGMEGAYFTEELTWAKDNGNIGEYPWDPDRPVQTYWDIGYGDHTSVLFLQDFDGIPHIVDHERHRNKGLPDWVKIINEKPYAYSIPHKGPHDIETHEWGSGRLRSETAYKMGMEIESVEKIGLEDGIDASRSMIRKVKFNESRTIHLRSALANYHRKWNAKRMKFEDKPFHDWSSDDADSFRYFSVDWSTPRSGRILVPDGSGNYTHNIKVRRAVGGVRSRQIPLNRSPTSRRVGRRPQHVE